ncbi:MAG: type II toxin-antitoxin system VapC family toxin [Propionibacteriaceae bacterium]|jgi:predicted nucleic acid-binding protein|nr:type II toxin-antitoxin system VapC family toxin [Propionibacteriaceae bacterium]
MIGYFDTSAIIPLVIAEPGSIRCAQAWESSDIRASSVLVIAEAHAALAQALRLERLTQEHHRKALELLDHIVDDLALITPTRPIVDRAAGLALTHQLRGYDAIHVASAIALDAPDLVAITADRRMLVALTSLGVNVIDTNPG